MVPPTEDQVENPSLSVLVKAEYTTDFVVKVSIESFVISIIVFLDTKVGVPSETAIT